MAPRASSPTAPPAPTWRPRSAPAWRAPRWRSGGRRRRAGQARRQCVRPRADPRPRPPLRDGDRVEIVTENADDADSCPADPHDTAHVLAAAVLDLYPGTKISIGPPIGDGFYYDFEFPEGVTVSEHDFEKLEAKMREHVKADEPFVREDIPVADALERFRNEHQDYKVELIEDLSSDQGETESRSTPTGRSPTSAAAAHPVDQARQGVQAAVDRRRVLARRRGPPDAHAHLRHGLPLQGGPRGPPPTARGGAGARPPRLGKDLGLFTFSEVSPGSVFLVAARDRDLQRARRPQPPHAGRARLRRGADAAALRVLGGRPPGTGASTRRTSSSPRTRSASSGSSR